MQEISISIVDITNELISAAKDGLYPYKGYPSNFLFCVRWDVMFDGKIVTNTVGPVPKKIAAEIAKNLLEAIANES